MSQAVGRNDTINDIKNDIKQIGHIREVLTYGIIA